MSNTHCPFVSRMKILLGGLGYQDPSLQEVVEYLISEAVSFTLRHDSCTYFALALCQYCNTPRGSNPPKLSATFSSPEYSNCLFGLYVGHY